MVNERQSCAEICKIISHYIIGFVTANEQQRVYRHLGSCRSCHAEFSRRVALYDNQELEDHCFLGFKILNWLTDLRTDLFDNLVSEFKADTQQLRITVAKLAEAGLVRVFKLSGGKMKVNITGKGEEVAQVTPQLQIH